MLYDHTERVDSPRDAHTTSSPAAAPLEINDPRDAPGAATPGGEVTGMMVTARVADFGRAAPLSKKTAIFKRAAGENFAIWALKNATFL